MTHAYIIAAIVLFSFDHPVGGTVCLCVMVGILLMVFFSDEEEEDEPRRRC